MYEIRTDVVLVLVAEAGADVVRVYESVGFAITERQVGASWWPERDQ